MFISCFILALSVSIDSLSIGITYGLKDTKISYIGKVTLFITSFIISIISGTLLILIGIIKFLF